ncbi:hypothetical protein TNCV_3898041 [Trichonephila clavipes]|nr:hypothetical protein TNCV_3898041 [Trichonephila clavipes]
MGTTNYHRAWGRKLHLVKVICKNCYEGCDVEWNEKGQLRESSSPLGRASPSCGVITSPWEGEPLLWSHHVPLGGRASCRARPLLWSHHVPLGGRAPLVESSPWEGVPLGGRAPLVESSRPLGRARPSCGVITSPWEGAPLLWSHHVPLGGRALLWSHHVPLGGRAPLVESSRPLGRASPSCGVITSPWEVAPLL